MLIAAAPPPILPNTTSSQILRQRLLFGDGGGARPAPALLLYWFGAAFSFGHALARKPNRFPVPLMIMTCVMIALGAHCLLFYWLLNGLLSFSLVARK